jgi:hypothetical protein
MSFDIFFQPCRYTGSPIEKTNPFNGEVKWVIPDEPLNAEELNAVRQVLKGVKADRPDQYNCYVVELADGGQADIFPDDGLATGCMVAVRGMTPELLQFLFDLLKAGQWAMLPAMENTVAITTSPDRMGCIPDDFPRVVVCNSAEELRILLVDGVQAWEKYRDQVVDGGG